MADADHAEYDPNTHVPFIAPISCVVPRAVQQDPTLSGALKIRLADDSLAFRILRRREIHEDYFCSYGLNPAFQDAIQAGGLRISGVDDDGEARVVELDANRFFPATLFLPQHSSTESAPHPLIVAFLQAAMEYHVTTFG